MRENRSLPGSCLHRSRLSPGSLSAGTASALVALAIFLLLLSAPFLYGDVSAGAGAPTAQDGSEQEGKKKKRKKGTKSKKSKLSPDALLVKKHLEDYLHPSSIKFLKGGRVKLLFAFSEKSEYSQKTYPSGRIGLAWGGSMSATVTNLEVTGKLDIPKMAKLLKKKLGLD